ncbi:MAG: alpha/beta fold hydrolase, partial [Proteobacteria bacterium]
MNKTKFFVLVLGLSILSFNSNSLAVGTNPSDPEFKNASADCRSHFDQYVKMGYSLKSLSVPEDWQNPSSKMIRLAYYLKNDFQKKNVVIFFNGGPASSANSSLSNLKLLSDKHPINFVVFDQRGTGCSSAYPADDEGIALYTSASIVNDAEALRTKIMGNEKWKIFGQSFGGLIVQRYLERHPEGVSHAYSHGYSQMEDPNEWMALRLKKQAELSVERISAYDAKNKDRKLLKRLKSFPETA